MSRKKKVKNDDSFSTNAVKNERMTQHENDLRVLKKAKEQQKGKRFICVPIKNGHKLVEIKDKKQ